MEFILENERNIPVAADFDVAVCGGGIAGIAAAVSAARQNKSVLLIENQFMLGGLATAGLVTIFLPLCDGEGHQVSFGICEELIKLSVSMGYEIDIPKHWKSDASPKERTQGRRYDCRYNAQVFAILCEKLLLSLGVKILYGSRVCATNLEDNRIKHIVVENKSGRVAYRVGAAVDATGDADLCVVSGVPTVNFSQGNTLAAWYYYTDAEKYKLNMLGFADVPDDNGKYSSGEKSLSRRRYSGLDGEELSDMVIDAHKALFDNFFKGGDLTDTHALSTIATIPQVRMTRRIEGEMALDTSHERKRFETSIGMVSDWRKRHDIYEVPFEILYNNRVKNLFCAGRCVSVTDAMWDIIRVIPDCAVTGEAAGIAAALAADDKADADGVINVLRKRGVPLHIDETL